MKLLKLTIAIGITLFLFGCVSTSTSNTNIKAKEDTPQRVFDLVDTSNSQYGDVISVNNENISFAFKAEKNTAILAAAYFIVENKLDDLTPDQHKMITYEFFRKLPARDSTKQTVLPKYSMDKQNDAYLFQFLTKNGDVDVYKIQTNIPISSFYQPGVYDGYIVHKNGNYSIGKIPKAWIANFYIYYNENYISYWGPSLTKNCAPLIYGNEDIKPDRSLTTVKKGPDTWKESLTRMKELEGFADQQLSAQTDEKQKTSIARLKKSALLSQAMYAFLLSDYETTNEIIKMSDEITLPEEKYKDFDNVANMKMVLNIAMQINEKATDW